jgi:hypothetical protein
MRTVGRFTAAAVALAGVATAWSAALVAAAGRNLIDHVLIPVKAAQCAGTPPSTGGV